MGDEPTEDSRAVRVDRVEADRPPRKRLAPPHLPSVSGRVAAAVTGLVVGVGGALLTYVSLRGCEVAKGTESCGGAGVPILAVILALMVLCGAFILGAWGFAEARGTASSAWPCCA